MADWFAPKRYGYGAGWPIAWQGWVVLIVYSAIVGGSIALFRDRPVVAFAILLPTTLILLLIAVRTTRGGWQWRWGRRR